MYLVLIFAFSKLFFSSVLFAKEFSIENVHKSPNEFFQKEDIAEYPEYGVVIDKNRKLMWAYKPELIEGKKVYLDWFKARDFCQKIDFLGHNDWQMANLGDLQIFYEKNKRYFESCKDFKKYLIEERKSFWLSPKCSCGKLTRGMQVHFRAKDMQFHSNLRLSHGEVLCFRKISYFD